MRYHNVYGPRMPQNTPYAGVASIFRSSLERGEAPRVMEDGRQRRDFVHVGDVAEANLAALETPAEEGRCVPLNVCSGEVRTIGDLATTLAVAMDGPGAAGRRRRAARRRPPRHRRPGPRRGAARLPRAHPLRRRDRGLRDGPAARRRRLTPARTGTSRAEKQRAARSLLQKTYQTVSSRWLTTSARAAWASSHQRADGARQQRGEGHRPRPRRAARSARPRTSRAPTGRRRRWRSAPRRRGPAGRAARRGDATPRAAAPRRRPGRAPAAARRGSPHAQYSYGRSRPYSPSW